MSWDTLFAAGTFLNTASHSKELQDIRRIMQANYSSLAIADEYTQIENLQRELVFNISLALDKLFENNELIDNFPGEAMVELTFIIGELGIIQTSDFSSLEDKKFLSEVQKKITSASFRLTKKVGSSWGKFRTYILLRYIPGHFNLLIGAQEAAIAASNAPKGFFGIDKKKAKQLAISHLREIEYLPHLIIMMEDESYDYINDMLTEHLPKIIPDLIVTIGGQFFELTGETNESLKSKAKNIPELKKLSDFYLDICSENINEFKNFGLDVPSPPKFCMAGQDIQREDINMGIYVQELVDESFVFDTQLHESETIPVKMEPNSIEELSSVELRLQKINKLRDKGLISESEYQNQRTEIINSI